MVPPMGFHVVGVRVIVPGKQQHIIKHFQHIVDDHLRHHRVHINVRTAHQRWQCPVYGKKTALLRAPLRWTPQLEAVLRRSTAAPKPDTTTVPESWRGEYKLSLPCHQSPAFQWGCCQNVIRTRKSNLYSTARLMKTIPAQAFTCSK